MINLRFSEEEFLPSYQTELSAGADLKAREDGLIPPQQALLVRTGVWIQSVDWSKVPNGVIPELQIRARSGLAYKHGITLMNGVGTIDIDYPEEIGVLLWNTRNQEFVVKKGDRIAQLVLNFVARIPSLPIGGERKGGFGSTGTSTSSRP